MESIVFTNKENIPSNDNLQIAIGQTYKLWTVLRDFVFFKYPNAIEECNFPGKNYGWSFRIKDKKRAIIYLLPRDGFFKVAFVLAKKQRNRF